MPTTSNEKFIWRALQYADMNALRIALYYQTGDPDLAEMTPQSMPIRGGAFEMRVVDRQHHEAIRKKAFSYLTQKTNGVKGAPSRDEAIELMSLFQGRSITQQEVDFGLEDLAFDSFHAMFNGLALPRLIGSKILKSRLLVRASAESLPLFNLTDLASNTGFWNAIKAPVELGLSTTIQKHASMSRVTSTNISSKRTTHGEVSLRHSKSCKNT